MKINELKANDLKALFMEISNLKGAKEIFKKFNIEFATKETELTTLKNTIDRIKDLLNTDENSVNYKNATQFLDLQINSNKAMLATANDFMKTMINNLIAGFETTKNGMALTFNANVAKEIEKLLDNLNENDQKIAKEIVSKFNLADTDKFFKEFEETLTDLISKRYSNEKVEEIEEPKKQEKSKEIEKDDLAKEILDQLKEPKEEPTEKKKESDEEPDKQEQESNEEPDKQEQESDEEPDDDFGDDFDFDDDDFFNEGPDKKSDTKKNESNEELKNKKNVFDDKDLEKNTKIDF